MCDNLKDKRMAIDIAKQVNKLGGRTFYVGGYVRDESIIRISARIYKKYARYNFRSTHIIF